MEKSFDLGSVLRQHQKKHKSKPTQFQSVADGVHRRLENSLKQRKSSRLTTFDCTRNLPQPSPVAETNASKSDSRRQQLQKWKIDKENKKKELAAKKIKPFIIGVPHNSLKYVPPPPARAAPSSSGRVTRSQTARNQKERPKKVQPPSFAPNNAGFRAPQIKTLSKMPQLGPSKNKIDVQKYKFQPAMPAMPETVRTRSQAYQRIVESRAKASKAEEIKPKVRIAKPVSKPYVKSKILQISSSSESESLKHTSASSSDVDLTARIISSSNSLMGSSTENDSPKSLQNSSSCGFRPEKQSLSKRRSFCNGSPKKTVSPHKPTQEYIQDKSKLSTPKNPIPKSESSSEERLRSPKSPVDMPMTPEQIAEEFKKISPRVTMSRGKDNARKEMKKKIEEGLLEEDASDMGVEHFQRQLASEIKQMTERCNEWDKIYEQVSLSETVQGLVLGAVGQARLLMSKKMQQFADLVQRCAHPEPGSTLVTPADLQGFWDMVFLQVENVDMRFKELEKLKARSWVEESAPVPAAARAPAPARAPRPASRPRGGASAPSRLRDMIAAARKAKAEEASQEASQPEERTFEAGFFCVRSPARSSHSSRSPARSSHSSRPSLSPHSPATPKNNLSLLKAVLSSEAQRASASKKAASFAMLHASVLGKNLEWEGFAPLQQSPLPEINLYATPGRSILKQPQEKNKSTIKQIKVVLFDHLDNEMDNTSTEDLNLSNEQVELQNTKIDLPKEQIEIDEAIDMDMEEKKPPQRETDDKQNFKRYSKLIRQDAVTTEISPVMTRRMQKNFDTSESEQNSKKKTPKRSSRKKVLAEVEIQMPKMEQVTQQTEQRTPPMQKKTSRRSSRKTVIAEEDVCEEGTPRMEQKSLLSKKKTPKRSSRKKVLAEVVDMQTLQTEQRTPQTEQKSPHSEEKTKKRSPRKKVIAEVENMQTPKTDQEISQSEQKTPKRSTRKTLLTELENNVQKENYTPIRSTRRKETVNYKF